MFDPGREQTIQIPGGKAVRLGRLTVAVIRAFGEYCAELVGDPFADVERFLGRAPEADVSRLLKEATEVRDDLRFFTLGTRVAQRALNTEQGSVRMMLLLMRQADPRATEDDASALVVYLSAVDRMGEVIRKASGGSKDEGEGAEGNAAGAPTGGSGGAT